MTQQRLLGRARRARPFFRGMPGLLAQPQRGANSMNNSDEEWVDRVGRRVSTAFLVGLAAMFLYGYLGHYIFG